jgi:hypothetical protein
VSLLRLLACLAFAVTLASSARAQPADTTAATTDEARSLYEKGVQHYRKQQWDKAYAAFLASWALKKHYSIAGNLAELEVKLGKYQDAAEHLRYYLKAIPADRIEPRHRAETQLAEIRKKVAAARIEVDTPGAEVLIDGKSVGIAPLEDEVFVEPGERLVEAKLEGQQPARQPLSARAGETHAVSLKLKQGEPALAPAVGEASAGGAAVGTSAAPAATPDLGMVEPAPAGRPSLVPAIAGGGVAVLGIGAGVIFHSIASSHESDADELRGRVTSQGGCGSGSALAACTALSEENDAVDRNRNLSTASFVVGGAGAAFAIGYLVWRELTPRNTSGLNHVPSAVVSSRGAEIRLVGSF